jgi:hypothetical protein
MRARFFGVVLLSGGCLIASLVQAQPAPAWAGTWKLDLTKSKYSPGPAPKSSTIKIEAAAGGGLKQTTDQVTASGESRHVEVTAMFDGKDAAVTGNPDVDMQAFKRVDDRSYEVTAKKNGKVTTITKVTISADGKTRTATQTGTDPQGRAVNSTIVYDRQ